MTRATIGPDAILHHQGNRYRVALGRAGITTQKQEGDGATPAGLLPLRRILYRADRLPRPKSPLPITLLAPNDAWCDDPNDPAYNTPITLPHQARHEALWREDPIYDLIAILGWNDSPPERNRGSAIFLHFARPDLSPTEGCIALSRPDLQAILAAGLTEIEVHA